MSELKTTPHSLPTQCAHEQRAEGGMFELSLAQLGQVAGGGFILGEDVRGVPQPVGFILGE